MSTRKTLLLVDGDTRSLRVLEVSLRKAGFTVNTAESSASALQWAFTEPPDLLIADTKLPDGSGFDLCQRIRSDNRTRHSVVVFLTEEASPETKIAGINAGADDFLTKPVLVKEIVSRVKTLLEKRRTDSLARRERPGNLSGTLSNMGVVDLLQVMETGKKSGIVHLSSDPIKSGGFVTEGEERGTIFFRDGEVIDAKLGRLTGLLAVYRMLLWDDGVFEIEFKAIARENTINSTTQAILLEGMRRVDEWSRFSDLIPPVNARLTVDYGALARAYPDAPAEMRPVLHVFDGRRTVFEVVNDVPGDDAIALNVIADLHRFGILQPASREGAEAAVEQWLSSQPAEPADLPSALGNAMIPSPDSASQILLASPRTELPIPLEQSHILSRHTVPANRALPLTSPIDAPIPLTETRVPRLQIQRVSSVVGRLPTAIPVPVPEPAGIEFEEDDGWDPIETAPSPTNLKPKIVPSKVSLPASQPSKVTSGPALASAELPARSAPAPRAMGASFAMAAAAAPPWQVPEKAKPAPLPDAAPTKKPLPKEEKKAPPPPPPPKEEPSSNTGEWYSKSGADDVLWDGESHPWRARIPGIALVASVVAVLVVLLAGGREHEEAPPKSPMEGAKSKRADWPATDDRAIVIKEDPTKASDPSLDPTKAPVLETPPVSPAVPPPVVADAAKTVVEPPTPPEPIVPPPKVEPSKVEPLRVEPLRVEPPKVDPPKSDPIASKATLEKAEASLSGGSLRAASTQFKKAIAEDTNNAEAYSGLAMVYVEMGQDRGAKNEALRALKIDGRQARAHLVLALIAANNSEMDKAKKSYQRYLELAPNGKHASEVRRILETLQ